MKTFEASCDVYAELTGPVPSEDEVRDFLRLRGADVKSIDINADPEEGEPSAIVEFSIFETDEEADSEWAAEDAIEEEARGLLSSLCIDFGLEEVLSDVIPSAWDVGEDDRTEDEFADSAEDA